MAENKKWSDVGEISTPSGTTKICVIHEPEGSGDPSNRLIDVNNLNYTKLSGTNYVFAQGNGTASKNATELQAAYNKAKTMSPSSGNTITVVVAPGTYTFGATKFPVNTPYINIVSLTGNADVLLDGINVTADNVYLKGLNCETSQFLIADNLDELVCERCVGGNDSFGGMEGTASGTFTNCTGGDNSFGGDYGAASGTFTNCMGGDSSFGGYGGTASGPFTNCIGGEYSFGGELGIVSGTFTNCTGGEGAFARGGTIQSTARLYYCRLTSGTFGTPASGGKLVLCIDGNNSPVTTPSE